MFKRSLRFLSAQRQPHCLFLAASVQPECKTYSLVPGSSITSFLFILLLISCVFCCGGFHGSPQSTVNCQHFVSLDAVCACVFVLLSYFSTGSLNKTLINVKPATWGPTFQNGNDFVLIECPLFFCKAYFFISEQVS